MNEEVKVFKCSNCGYEDSSFIPDFYKHDKVDCPECKANVDKTVVLMNYEPYMTLKEYYELVKYISENHSFGNWTGRKVKYITMTLDFRSNTIHHVRLDDKEFCKVNQNRHKNLDKWIREWLISK